MTIYTPFIAHPYVYRGVHRITGKVYIGSRTTQKLKYPASIDFGYTYKTSSEYVAPIFDEFDWIIVAEFIGSTYIEAADAAYLFEQELIYNEWQISKENSLNKSCYHLKRAFNYTGVIVSEDTRMKQRAAKVGHKRSIESRIKQGKTNKNKVTSEETKRKQSLSGMNRVFSEEHRKRLSNSASVFYDFLTPDGFWILNITMKEFCETFSIVYCTSNNYFRRGIQFKGFTRFSAH